MVRPAALLTLLLALALPASAAAEGPDHGVGRDLAGQTSDSRGYVPQAHPDGAFGSEYVGDRSGDRRERRRALRHQEGDPDWDGVSTRGELESGTDPLSEDSDGDGYRDGEEDPDSDGITSEEEEIAGLNLTKKDSDGNGLADGREGAGRVASFEGGTLTVESLDEGRDGTQRAEVDEWTTIVCSELDEGSPSHRETCGSEALSEGAVIHSSRVVDGLGRLRFGALEVVRLGS